MSLDLHLGRPLTRGGLSLFPVWNGAAVSRRGYDVHSPLVSVREQDGVPVVGELVVRNAGARPALVLDGELLEGGRQHRIAARSVVVEPGAPVVLPVHCVEQGRWAGVSAHARRGRRAPSTVRAARDQSAVWQEVSRYEQRYGSNATHSLLDAAAPVERDAEALVHGLRPLPFQTGVLVGVGGHPLLLEVYDSPRTLAHVWDELLRAVALDALQAAAVPTPGRRARRFVDRVVAADDGDRADLEVRSLVWRERVVHAVAVNPRHPLVAA